MKRRKHIERKRRERERLARLQKSGTMCQVCGVAPARKFDEINRAVCKKRHGKSKQPRGGAHALKE